MRRYRYEGLIKPGERKPEPVSDGQRWQIHKHRRRVFGVGSPASWAVFYAWMRETIGVEANIESLTYDQAARLLVALKSLPTPGQGQLVDMRGG